MYFTESNITIVRRFSIASEGILQDIRCGKPKHATVKHGKK